MCWRMVYANILSSLFVLLSFSDQRMWGLTEGEVGAVSAGQGSLLCRLRYGCCFCWMILS